MLTVAALAARVCQAQRRGGFAGPGHVGGSFHSGRNGAPFDRRRSDYGAYLGGDPFLWYGDDLMPPQPNAEPGPPVLMLRPDISPQPRLTPLLIELEGDHYVRHGGTSQSAHGEVSREPRAAPASTQDYSAREESGELTPTMLVFRDGHREQVPDYAIVGRVLYAHSDFDGEPGYGLKSIQLSALDIPATVRMNRENGVSFVLPSGPNEVVTRP